MIHDCFFVEVSKFAVAVAVVVAVTVPVAFGRQVVGLLQSSSISSASATRRSFVESSLCC